MFCRRHKDCFVLFLFFYYLSMPRLCFLGWNFVYILGHMKPTYTFRLHPVILSRFTPIKQITFMSPFFFSPYITYLQIYMYTHMLYIISIYNYYMSYIQCYLGFFYKSSLILQLSHPQVFRYPKRPQIQARLPILLTILIYLFFSSAHHHQICQVGLYFSYQLSSV